MNHLKKFMNSIPIVRYKGVKDEIVSKCHITDDIWRNWLTGRTPIPPLAQDVIRDIAGYDIFEEQEAFQK